MDELRVYRDADKLNVQLFEACSLVVKLTDLGRADESKISWPEEKHDILAYKTKNAIIIVGISDIRVLLEISFLIDLRSLLTKSSQSLTSELF